MRSPEQIADAILATVAVVTEDREWLRNLLILAAREAREPTTEGAQ